MLEELEFYMEPESGAVLLGCEWMENHYKRIEFYEEEDEDFLEDWEFYDLVQVKKDKDGHWEEA